MFRIINEPTNSSRGLTSSLMAISSAFMNLNSHSKPDIILLILQSNKLNVKGLYRSFIRCPNWQGLDEAPPRVSNVDEAFDPENKSENNQN